jgi:hypothetical protein
MASLHIGSWSGLPMRSSDDALRKKREARDKARGTFELFPSVIWECVIEVNGGIFQLVMFDFDCMEGKW